jgi:hypothetical protein
MNTTNEVLKPLVFCLDKSANSTLKQCLHHFSPRFFTDGKYLIKRLILNKKTEFLPSALILTGDYHSVKEILTNAHCQTLKIFIFCQNFTRQVYEPLMMESKSIDHIMGLFTMIGDLKDALEDILIKPIHNRQLIRFITGNLDSYLWYEFLKETSMKIQTVPPKQTIDVSIINRQIEYDPFISLYTLRSAIRHLSQRTISHKKIFYGNVIKKDLIEQLQSNIDNIISFNSFVHLQGHHRSLDARHQSLQCCSRRYDEVSIIFELELADQPTFKIVRIFNSNDDINLWIIQLIGTHECVKLSKQFSHMKRTTTSLIHWQQPEILFGNILIEMNEIDDAYRFFFEILVNQYDQLNKIYTKARELWNIDGNYPEVIRMIASEFQQIKSIKSDKQTTNQGKDEDITYFESEFDSTWDPPIALTDASKINDLLAPISYRVDQVLCGGTILKSSTPTSSRRRCTLF